MKATQKVLQVIVVLLIALTAFQACKKEKANLSGTYSVSVNQMLSIPQGGNQATLLLTKLADSRCPANAICTTAGNAVATITVHDNNQDQTINVALPDNGTAGNTRQIITINDTRYFIKLTEVTPFPTLPASNEPKKATIVLSTERI